MRALTSLKIASDQSNVLATTTTQPHSAPFQENASALNALLQDLNGKVARICEGGGAKAVERHRKRNKLPPRERIGAFLDQGSPFLEFSQLAGFNLYGDSRSFLAPRLKQCDGAPVLLLRYFAVAFAVDLEPSIVQDGAAQCGRASRTETSDLNLSSFSYTKGLLVTSSSNDAMTCMTC